MVVYPGCSKGRKSKARCKISHPLPWNQKKRVSNEEDLQKELDKLRIELRNSKSHQKFLEDQLLKKEKIKASLNQ
jgi:hypothetical protein